jgi:hypothetical protein
LEGKILLIVCQTSKKHLDHSDTVLPEMVPISKILLLPLVIWILDWIMPHPMRSLWDTF